ncbi:hypothetical protein PM082_000675 [Marasmius tenuissimus]|nr:hypothetical protein PM082_000675 [Marasmius tenuissimus]
MIALRPKTKNRAGLASHPPAILEEGASVLARSSSVGSVHAQVMSPVVASASILITASISTSTSALVFTPVYFGRRLVYCSTDYEKEDTDASETTIGLLVHHLGMWC